jgi:hypothetical protein
MREPKEGERLGVRFALSEKLTESLKRQEDTITKTLLIQAKEAVLKFAEKEGIDLRNVDCEVSLKSVVPSFEGKFYEANFEIVILKKK